MADCDKDQECEKIVPEPIKPEPLPKQCSGGGDESGSGTNDFNELENRPKYGGRKMTGETDIPDLSSTIEQLSGEINIKTPMITNYDGEVGENVTDQRPYIVTEDKDSITPEELVNETTIDGASLVVEVNANEGTATLYTAQIVTDAETGDYAIEWSEVGGGSSTPYNVYSTKTTSNNNNHGGAIYLGALDSNQEQIEDPTTTDNHYRYFHALPYSKTKVPADRTILIGSEVVGNPSSYIGLGFGGTVEASEVINIGGYYCGGNGTVVLGKNASWRGSDGVALGYNAGDANTYVTGAVSLGAYSKATRSGEVNVGSVNTSFGFNNTHYRVIGGVYDGQDAHDAANVGQITPLTDSTAPTTSTVGTLGKIYIDTSTATAYMCVEVDDVTPSYTWKQITA